jgi:hypothetical protein
MDSSIIASVELGRVPLKYAEAVDLLLVLGGGKVNPLWLSSGDEPMLFCRFYGLAMPEAGALGFKDRDYFSRVMDACSAEIKAIAKAPSEWSNLPKPWLQAQRDRVRFEMEGLVQQLASWQAIATELDDKLGTLDYDADESPEKHILTHAAISEIVPDVKSVMRDLRKRLAKVAQPRGKKAELARFLGAPLSSVSRWLSGLQEPGGETTLRLLQWVEQEERQQKESPASVNAPAGPKTQVRRPNK